MSSLRQARKFIIGCAIIALVAPISIDWTVAYRSGIKTGDYQHSGSSSFSSSQQSGQGPSSVYGGYGQQSGLSPPVNQRKSPYVKPQQQQQQQQPQYSQEGASSSYNEQNAEADSEPAQYGSVSGKAGQDFPALTSVPKTSFSCDGLPYDYGMYADEETGCQAYHLCYNGRKDSFLCGPGTVFNQRILHCDYWYSVDCAKSSQYWGSNAYMGSSQPEPGPAQASGSYQRGTEVSPASNRPGSGYGGYNQSPASSSQSQTWSRQPFRQQQQQSPISQQQSLNYRA